MTTKKPVVKFPFEVNERTKAVFNNEAALKASVRIITEALLDAASLSTVNPWKVLLEEHPELKEYSDCMVYSYANNSIKLRSDKWKLRHNI